MNIVFGFRDRFIKEKALAGVGEYSSIFKFTSHTVFYRVHIRPKYPLCRNFVEVDDRALSTYLGKLPKQIHGI